MKEAYFSQYQLVAAYTHSLFKGKSGEQLPVFGSGTVQYVVGGQFPTDLMEKNVHLHVGCRLESTLVDG